ncbi:MAG: FAD-dependent oxidoreductase [Candidatus Paceibacterota bacterium]|jgi:ferredoxin-NADP reductase
MQIKTKKLILVDKKYEAENIVSLIFKTSNKDPYIYLAGQYVSVYLFGLTYPKSYTISSSPKEKLVTLTIKKIGNFSTALYYLNIGDSIKVEGPYGDFYPKIEDNCVFLASGIGVTPFISIIKDRLEKTGAERTSLFYSNKTFLDIAFFDLLNKIKSDGGLSTLVYFLTQQEKTNPLVKEYNRMNTGLIKKYIKSFKNKSFYICGSISFVNDMLKNLKESGVPENFIFTESFY